MLETAWGGREGGREEKGVFLRTLRSRCHSYTRSGNGRARSSLRLRPARSPAAEGVRKVGARWPARRDGAAGGFGRIPGPGPSRGWSSTRATAASPPSRGRWPSSLRPWWVAVSSAMCDGLGIGGNSGVGEMVGREARIALGSVCERTGKGLIAGEAQKITALDAAAGSLPSHLETHRGGASPTLLSPSPGSSFSPRVQKRQRDDMAA